MNPDSVVSRLLDFENLEADVLSDMLARGDNEESNHMTLGLTGLSDNLPEAADSAIKSEAEPDVLDLESEAV